MEKSIRLNDGQTMPMVGFGTYQMPRRLTQQCVEQALEVGYRHIDTAPHYRAAYPSTVELAYNHIIKKGSLRKQIDTLIKVRR